MKYCIKTEGEVIILAYPVETEGAIEVEVPEDFITCGDTANKYKFVNGKIEQNGN